MDDPLLVSAPPDAKYFGYFTKNEVFNLSQLGVNLILTLIVFIIFIGTLDRQTTVKTIPNVTPQEATKYTVCNFEQYSDELEKQSYIFDCDGNIEEALTAWSIHAFTQDVSPLQTLTGNYTCYLRSYSRDSKGNREDTYYYVLVDTDFFKNDNAPFYAIDFINLVYYYHTIKSNINNPNYWSFPENLWNEYFEVLRKGSFWASYEDFITLNNNFTGEIFDVYNNPVTVQFSDQWDYFNMILFLYQKDLEQRLGKISLSYSCLDFDTESTLDFWLRASSYTFFVTLIFMLFQFVVNIYWAVRFD